LTNGRAARQKRKQKLFTTCEYVGAFLSWFMLVFFLNLWFNILKMNEEETFQYGPFTVIVHPATNEEDEWFEVEDCE